MRRSTSDTSSFAKITTVAALAALGAFTGACGGGGSVGDDNREITYFEDVKPIIDAKCARCHTTGGVAPFALEDFEDAAAYAGASLFAIDEGIMPPWKPSADCRDDYVGDFSLTPEEIDVFRRWVDAGTPEGDPSKEGAAIDIGAPTLSRVDLAMAMPEPYVAQTTADYTDDYRCFVMPWTEQTTKFVTGFRAVPGNPTVVHHVIAFLAEPGQQQAYLDLDAADPDPGYECFGGTGGPAQSWIGGWAPGNDGSDLPEGIGIRIDPGSTIILQVHYNTLNVGIGNEPEPDTTAIELKLDDQVDVEALVLPWANPQWLTGDNMRIAANDPDATHSFAFDPTLFLGGSELEIYTASLHMHLLGRSGRLAIERSDGSSDCLLQIDDWDFAWQGGYELAQPAVLSRGDVLSIECHWDNSAANQPLVNGEKLPPVDVFWGEGSTDEMCLGAFIVAQP